MKADVSADGARRRNDDGVRRLREESARRINRNAHWRAFTGGCALATLVGGISLAALDAHEARVAEQDARRSAASHEAAISNACVARAAARAAIESAMYEHLARAKTEMEREAITAEASARWAAAINAAADKGCGERVASHAPARSERPDHKLAPRRGPYEEAAPTDEASLRDRSVVDDPALSE